MTETALKNEKKKTKKKFKIRKKELELYSLCVIPVLLIIAFCYVPMGGIIIAFKNYRYDKGIFGSEWVGFDNFRVFLQSRDFPKLIRNTVGMNAIFIITTTIAALAIAILLYQVTSRGMTKFYQTSLITPTFVSWVLVSYVVYALLSPEAGVVNAIIRRMGGENQNWYATPKIWPLVLTVCNAWKGVGMTSIYYYASLMGIDQSLFEAADIDGAGRWDKVRHIMLPSLVPIVTILTIMSIGGIFNADFGLFYQVPRDVGALYDVTDVISTYTFRLMRVIGDMGTGTAVGLMQSLVGLILVILTNSISKKIDKDLGLF